MSYVTTRTRSPHAQIVIDSPLFVAARPGAGLVLGWADVENPQEFEARQYEVVRVEEVERLQGGSYEPHSKDIGMYRDFSDRKKGDPVRIGKMVLMKCRKDIYDERTRREQDQLMRRKPKKSDLGGSDQDEVREETSTVGAELR